MSPYPANCRSCPASPTPAPTCFPRDTAAHALAALALADNADPNTAPSVIKHIVGLMDAYNRTELFPNLLGQSPSAHRSSPRTQSNGRCEPRWPAWPNYRGGHGSSAELSISRSPTR
ncbi:hypothetical protein GCM10010507_37670 [Streptomyces cinnamoneus]|uniref:Uncharacterized protein n=1 Tax=Streptomyces cinnamoneus TaxID=53446 RepID=A0A918TSR1_STRCJ|nr:hypothetical protein GCM10010507_37670 [Streptomyces cinnamoneus]